jgi:hypothetical protein
MATRSTLRNSRGGLPPSSVTESLDSLESRNGDLNEDHNSIMVIQSQSNELAIRY